MSELESLVRPFQTERVDPLPYYTPGQQTPQLVILQFGRGGGGKIANSSISASASFYCERYENEKRDAD